MSDSSAPSPAPARRASATVPVPTRGTLFLRTFLPWQVWRFISINLRMIAMIRRSHNPPLRRPAQKP